jgi:clan AA aspartic protease (TIGR02281 family)
MDKSDELRSRDELRVDLVDEDHLRKRRIGNYKFVAIGLVSVAIVTYGYWSKSYGNSSILGHGVLARLDSESRAIVQRLEDEPCNQGLASRLATRLVQQDEDKAVVTLFQNQARQCSANDALLPLVFSAQMKLSNFAEAEKSANAIIQQYPADPSAFGWRSEAREKRKNFSGAYADMRRAILLFPDPSNVAAQVYYDAARLAAKAGDPCTAVLTLRDYIAFGAQERRNQQLDRLMQGWQKQGSCPILSGVGCATLRYDTHATGIIVPEVNGILAHMLLDTGASRTLVSPNLAKEADIKRSDLQNEVVTTANGQATVLVGRADKISLGGASLRNVPVYIQNSAAASLGDGIEGLLGLSFLGNFQIHIANGALELKPLQ